LVVLISLDISFLSVLGELVISGRKTGTLGGMHSILRFERFSTIDHFELWLVAGIKRLTYKYPG